MRWGVEVWDRFEEVSNYVHKGIEFCERYEDFLKKRCSVENAYAKSLRKLIESFEPKRKETDETTASHTRCFVRMLGELRDVAGQHELIAESVQEKVLTRLSSSVKALKEERRKCIEDKERCLTEHAAFDEQLDKCKLKYERAHKEVEKAEDLLTRVENDDAASKNDIKKQKAVCEQKKRVFDALEAEYGKQLCEANRVKNAYYYEQLPAVFDVLQGVEKKRIENFKELVQETVNAEIEVLPRIRQCFAEIEASAQAVEPDQDTEIVVHLFKTGYPIPSDHLFEDLTDKSCNSMPREQLNGSISSNTSNGGGSGGGGGGNGGHAHTLGGHVSLASTTSLSNANGSMLSSNGGGNGAHPARQKKYRTLNKIKGLFVPAGKSGSGDGDSLYELPPQQLKNELLKKMGSIQAEIEKQQKEREGLNKLKDIYSKNQKFGDSQSAELALKANEEKLHSLSAQLKKFQDIYNQVDLNQQQQYQLHLQQQQQQQLQHHPHHSQQHQLSNQYSSGEYSSSSAGSSSNGVCGNNAHTAAGGNTSSLPRDNTSTLKAPSSHQNGTTPTTTPATATTTTASNSNHVYQSPGDQSTSANWSLPCTPLTQHQYGATPQHSTNSVSAKQAVPMGNSNNINNKSLSGGSNSSTAAYAISPVNQLGGVGSGGSVKIAPLVGSNNQESFDDDDDDDDNNNNNDDNDNDDGAVDNDDGCYESPSAHLKQQQHSTNNAKTNGVNAVGTAAATANSLLSTTLTTTSTSISTINASRFAMTTPVAATTSTAAGGSIYAEGQQYDQVDSTNLYEQTAPIDDQLDGDDPIIGTALVMYSFTGSVQNAMSIQENESLNVLEKDSGDGWTLVKRLSGEKGYVPTDYIRIVYY